MDLACPAPIDANTHQTSDTHGAARADHLGREGDVALLEATAVRLGAQVPGL